MADFNWTNKNRQELRIQVITKGKHLIPKDFIDIYQSHHIQTERPHEDYLLQTQHMMKKAVSWIIHEKGSIRWRPDKP